MRPWLLFASALAVSACASLSSMASGDGETVVYGADADENLKRGEEALESKNFPDAQRYFEYVKTKYPYLESAKTAELRLADTEYERDRFLEARDKYQNFIRLHPTHPKVDYAAYRAALTFYKDMPSQFFLLPPSEEKDQADVRGAFVALLGFVRDYPDSSYLAEAKTSLDDVKRRLAEHELYVASFYARRDKWPAVVSRLNVVASSYGGIGYDERVYFGLYDAYRKLKDDERAREALRSYVAKYPDQAGAKRAQKVLGAAEPLPATRGEVGPEGRVRGDAPEAPAPAPAK